MTTSRKELGIKSPSTVFRDHVRHIDGLVLGIADQLPDVKMAAVNLSGAALPVSYQGGNRGAAPAAPPVQFPSKLTVKIGE